MYAKSLRSSLSKYVIFVCILNCSRFLLSGPPRLLLVKFYNAVCFQNCSLFVYIYAHPPAASLSFIIPCFTLIVLLTLLYFLSFEDFSSHIFCVPSVWLVWLVWLAMTLLIIVGEYSQSFITLRAKSLATDCSTHLHTSVSFQVE